MKNNVLNYTPHEINMFDADGNPVISIRSQGVARVTMEYSDVAPVLHNGATVKVAIETPGSVMGLPKARKGICLIVSRVVHLALPERTDLLVQGNEHRNEAGRVIGCEYLVTTKR